MTVVDLDTHRLLKIGGSEAAAACGVSPFESPYELWWRKTEGIEREETEAMRFGTLLEPVIFAELERRGFDVIPAPAEEWTHDHVKWMTGHVDGFVSLDGHRAVLEIKTAGSWSGHDWHSDAGAPLPYLVQCHHYMALTGLDYALLACLVGGQRLELRTVKRDEAAMERIIVLEDRFVHHLRTNTPPPPSGSKGDEDALRARFPESNGKTIRLDGKTWEAVKELKARKEQLDVVKRQVAELQQTVELAMGDAEHAVSPFDTPAARWPTVQQTRLDTTALKAARPDVYQEFAVSKPTRRFTVE